MEDDEGTCSRPPFFPLPLSLLLPLPFICNSTQEPVRPAKHHFIKSRETKTHLKVYQWHAAKRPRTVANSDNIECWEGAHKHAEGEATCFFLALKERPQTWGCCLALQLLLVPPLILWQAKFLFLSLVWGFPPPGITSLCQSLHLPVLRSFPTKFWPPSPPSIQVPHLRFHILLHFQ